MRASDPSRRHGWPGVAVALIGVAVFVGSVHAQQPSREQEQIRRLRQQAQQLQQERAGAVDEARKATAEAQQLREEQEAQAAAARRRQGQQAQRIGELEAQLAAAKAELQAQQARLSEAQQQSAGETEKLRKSLAERDARIAQMEDTERKRLAATKELARRNAELYALGVELLQRYRDKGVAEALAQQEPFLKLKQVQLENLAQDYEERLEKGRSPTTPR